MRSRRVVCIYVLLILTNACDRTKPKNMGQTKEAVEKFEMLADSFVKQSLALSPTNASQAGYHRHQDARTGKEVELDAILDEVSPQAWSEQLSFYRGWKTRMQKELNPDDLDSQNRADWQLIDDQLSLSLLELENIQSYKHNPTLYVELLGNALFLPLSQSYASPEIRFSHVLSRMEQIPRFVQQTKEALVDSDPIFLSTALEENQGNIELIEKTVKAQLPANAELVGRFEKSVPKAVAALKDLSIWLQQVLAKRPPSSTWRIGKDRYAEKFGFVMQTPVTPDQVLADAESELLRVRSEMLEIALPLHRQMFAPHRDHDELTGKDRENKVIGEVLDRIADEHADRNHLVEAVKGDLDSITQFIRDKKIVGLSDRNNLKVIETPPFMRGIYSVAGFHNAPALEPNAEAQYWVTPIDPKMPKAQAESKLREYNNYTLKWLTIHEALPGHYVQFEHANSVEPARRRLLRSLYGNGAYIEGWAEYIAQVMMEEGFLHNDPKFGLVIRKIRLRVIGNVILDIKMQTMNMTDQQALDLMTKDCFQTQAEADGKLVRAKLSSAQLPTYYVGIRDWLKLREDYKAKLGTKFSLEDFHNRALDQGPLPISLLRRIMFESVN